MGFYLRKSVNLGGGVRLNLSKSGFGLSAGVKGLRLGMNGRGTYVHMGRGGLYYRQQFVWEKKQKRKATPPNHKRDQHHSPTDYAAPDIYYTEALDLPLEVSSGAADVEDVLKHFRPNVGLGWLPLSLGIVGLLSMLHSSALSVFFFVLCAASLVALPFLHSREILVYNLDDDVAEKFADFVNEIEAFMQANRLWLYENRSVTTDWKRNAGATNLIGRRLASFGIDRRIPTNISVPCLSSGGDRIYFLPDLVVCVNGNNVAAFPYSEFDLHTHIARFIEEEAVPSDAAIVDYTWRFVNKGGGPDRRFNNNRKIPVCAYQELDIAIGPSFRRIIAKSRQADVRSMDKALSNLRAKVHLVERLPTPSALPSPAVASLSP